MYHIQNTAPVVHQTRQAQYSHQWDCGWVGLRIGDISLNTIAVYVSVLLDIISISMIGEHLGIVSYKYITTILIIDFNLS